MRRATPGCTWLAVTLAGALGCASTPAAEDDPPRLPMRPFAEELQPRDGAALLLAMERTPCEGTCPVYRVRVWTDGRVAYHGDWNVAVQGPREARLGAVELARLRVLLARLRLGALDVEAYRCPHGHIDLPGVVLAAPAAGLGTPICYAALQSVRQPVELEGVDIAIDALLRTERWTGDLSGLTTPGYRPEEHRLPPRWRTAP